MDLGKAALPQRVQPAHRWVPSANLSDPSLIEISSSAIKLLEDPEATDFVPRTRERPARLPWLIVALLIVAAVWGVTERILPMRQSLHHVTLQLDQSETELAALRKELVTDRDLKTPADRSVATQIKNEAMANGLVIYPGGCTADGKCGAHILLAPPFIYDRNNVDELVGKLVRVLDAVDVI